MCTHDRDSWLAVWEKRASNHYRLEGLLTSKEVFDDDTSVIHELRVNDQSSKMNRNVVDTDFWASSGYDLSSSSFQTVNTTHEILHQIEQCESANKLYWQCTIYAKNGLLLIFGCFLAYETRQVHVPAMNDSK